MTKCLLRVALLAASVAASPWEGLTEAQCDGQGLFQTSARGRSKSGRSPTSSPLDKRVYVTLAWHKAGTQLMRNTMRWIWDLLDAREACRYDGDGVDLISHGFWEQDCPEHPDVKIRFNNHANQTFLPALRADTASSGGFKGVMTLRDPLEMVISSYCYHHRGAEPKNPISVGMVELGPKEGVPEMAKRMAPIIRDMFEVFQVAKPEVYVSHFERMTGSSSGFNQTVKEILDFLFGDEVSDHFKRRALDAAAHEDLNRGEDGFSFSFHSEADNQVNHTSDDQELNEARSYLSLVDQELLEELLHFQKALGYPPTAVK